MANKRREGQLSRSLAAVELEIKEVSAAVKGVEGKITVVEDKISEVDSKLDSIDVELQRPKLGKAAKLRLLRKEEDLRREREWLRTKEERLWIKEELLLKKEEELRAEARATVSSSVSYLQRVLDMEAPSKTNMKREQLDKAGGPLINNWRPTQEAAGGLLPALAHLTFGEVAELLASDAAVDQDAVNVAGQLCCICAEIYDNEAQLTKHVRGLLLPYLEGPAVVQITSGFAGTNVSPDWALGDRANDPTNLFLIGEFKAGIGGSGDSHFQGANYHLHFWRRRTASNIFKDTRCPAFLLEVVGPHVRLSAVAWLDRVTIFPLTPLLNLLPAHPVTKSLLMPVARMLAALRVGLRKLAQAHAAMPVHTADEPDQVAQAGPGQAGAQETREAEADAAEPGAEDAVAKAEDAVKAEDVQRSAGTDVFKLPWPIAMDARYDAETARLLANYTYYVGLDGIDESVVVKLCESYGLEAHQEWADLGLAPKILRSTTLPGGWLLVEMEWLPAPEWRPLSGLSEKELRQAERAVQQALERAHIATNMVHGDVRPPNCLVRRGKGAGSWEVRFVDFEWAGPEGEATYPACLNTDIPWPEGVRYGKPLQREHDIQLLAATLAARRAAAAPSTTTSATAGRRRGTRGPGAAQSLHTAANYRSAVAPGTAAVSAGHRIVRVSWRQRGAISWTRTAAPGRPLVW